MKKKNLVSGLIASFVGFSQTIQGNATEHPGQAAQSAICDEDTRILVLTEADPISNWCPTNSELSADQIAKCQKIVACMIAEGVVIDGDAIGLFGGPGGASGQVPDKDNEK